MNYDLTKMCRICLKEDIDLTPLFQGGENSLNDVSIPQKIMACTAIQIIAGDGLPDMICVKCVVEVGIAYDFREKCQSADATIKKYLSIMAPFIKPTQTEENSARAAKSGDSSENSLYFPIDSINETSNNETNVYDFDKESFSSTGEKSHQEQNEDSDSDAPLIIRQQKFKKKKKMKERNTKLKKEKLPEHINEEISDSDKRKRLKDEGDIECPICKKTFAYMCILKDHMVQHTGARPYLCSACGKSFAHTTSLTNHMKTHYADKPHKCERCNLSFHRKAHLVLHMRTHTGEKPFVCDVCGRDFAQNNYLKEHMKLHSGEKPFKCDVCGHGFARKSCLVMHRRVHTGELPYSCPECGRAFSQRSQRKRHVKRNHKGSACLRETGELILKDLDYKNRKLQENFDSMLSESSLSSSQRDSSSLLADTWTISLQRTNAVTMNNPLSDNSMNQLDNTSSLSPNMPLPLTLQIPRSLLQ